MVARLVACWLLVVQVVPTVCCFAMARQPALATHLDAARSRVTSCCGVSESACDENDTTFTLQSDVARAPACCALCETVCCADEPAPLERKDQRRESGRPLGPEVLYAEGSYPAGVVGKPGLSATRPSGVVRWANREPLRPLLQVWLI